ncbi:hypothetical protein LGH70_16845 [Hymenobacter sp. BT635]|uniref:Uncharacterized protein n=1 Tax=Hymenobacter nitidus TaxID=2880929 RepID=A0ABS8AH27_9BACT|nr:hypothetical protein [Hymenobacter nitidus]MCB2379267.1 hypothetical protein [Hymenobacter nitidus]
MNERAQPLNNSAELQLLNICRILAKHKVEYLIVGGTAVGIYGYSRMTIVYSGAISDKYDFDFWYNSSYANHYLLLDALEEIGVNVSKFRSEQVPNPKKSFFQHSFPDFTLDFLPEILGVGRFADAFRSKVVSTV